MQEFLLYSQIPAAREHQVLSILAGFTGTHPVPICEQTLLFAQVKVPDVHSQAGRRGPAAKAQQQQQQQAARPHYQKLNRDVPVPNPRKKTLLKPAVDSPWVIRSEQVPDPGTKEWISRSVIERPATDEDLVQLRDPALFRRKTQYLARGHRFVHGNVVVKICLHYVSRAGTSDQDTLADLKGLPVPKLEDDVEFSQIWQPLDPSGTLLIEATVRIADSNNEKLRGTATEELLTFKSEMAGAVDLFMPDRLALDTRVKTTT